MSKLLLGVTIIDYWQENFPLVSYRESLCDHTKYGSHLAIVKSVRRINSTLVKDFGKVNSLILSLSAHLHNAYSYSSPLL